MAVISVDSETILQRAFREGLPVVAFLGQSIGHDTSPQRSVLAAALAKADRDGHSWKSLLRHDQLAPEYYDWLANQFLHRAPTPEMLTVADAQFSAIYTSSVDPRLPNLFETGGREPEVVLLGDPPPPIRRSRRRPPFYALFGRAGVGIADFEPPASLPQLAQRRVMHASPMARTILETATALGIIVIDGYDPNSDWFRAEDLLALLTAAPKCGVLWCGPAPQLTEDDGVTFDHLTATGVIIRDERSLAVILSHAVPSDAGTFAQHWDDPEVVSLSGGRKLITSPSLRLATEASATIVDDALTGFIDPLSEMDRQIEFRNFHAVRTGARSLIGGVQRGFSIERDFEHTLQRYVRRAVAKHHEEAGAIIVHGQSGVGKTIALARLALILRASGDAAVLFAFNSLPQAADVSEFLNEIDALNAVTVLLVDASVLPGRYDDLLNALRSRGHRAVVVGTSYRQENASALIFSRYVEARNQLSAGERQKLEQLSSIYLPAGLNRGKMEFGQYALAGFFYQLPASRPRISEGLGKEARSTGGIIAKAGSRRKAVTSLGSLGGVLVEAGFPQPTAAILENDDQLLVEFSSETAANRLIDYVMVASRLYKWVPINLLLRAVKGEASNGMAIDLELIRELFEGHDLFRWRFDDEEGGELVVGARLQLEAELICSRRMGGAAAEAKRIIELILAAVRAGPEGEGETRFVADLVFALGPDGPSKDRYAESYAEVARALTQLRELRGVENARLMLQEATLRRHYIRLQSAGPRFSSELKTQLLDEARSAVDSALQKLEKSSGRRLYASRRTIDNLWVERAATYGFIATDAAANAAEPSEVWRSYLAARTAARRAFGRVDTYFPLDIALWLPSRILREAPNLEVGWRVELEADIRSTLDLVDPEALDAKQFEIFQKQRFSCGDVLDDIVVSDDAFEELRTSGSTAGYYVRARSLAPGRPDNGEKGTLEDVSKARHAADYLWAAYDTIAVDLRCLQLLLSCEWMATTGTWLFRGRRQPLPSRIEDQQNLRKILTDIVGGASDEIQAKYRYLDAVFTWLMDDERSANEKFRKLSTDTEYIESGRVISRHVIADNSGQALVFNGTAVRKTGERRWSVFVDELRKHVDLVETDFKNLEIKAGFNIRKFSIGFNFIGSLAKPEAAD